MQRIDLSFYAIGLTSVLIGLSIGGFVFGMLVHESSHAITCRIFDLPYSWSLTLVQYVKSTDPIVNILVGLAGGIGQTLFSYLFYWYFTTLEKVMFGPTAWKILLENRRPLKLSILLGFELAFLTIAFHGIINAVWEGLFYQSYEQVYGMFVLWGTIILLCVILSLYIIYRRYLQLGTR